MDLIEKFLEEEMGFGDRFLFMTESITKALGAIDASKIKALELAIKKTDMIPPEIAFHGLRNIGVYMTTLGYPVAKEIMLSACRSIK